MPGHIINCINITQGNSQVNSLAQSQVEHIMQPEGKEINPHAQPKHSRRDMNIKRRKHKSESARIPLDSGIFKTGEQQTIM